MELSFGHLKGNFLSSFFFFDNIVVFFLILIFENKLASKLFCRDLSCIMQARRGLFTNGSLFKNVCMVLNILPDIYHLDYNHLTRLYQKLMGFPIFFFPEAVWMLAIQFVSL